MVCSKKAVRLCGECDICESRAFKNHPKAAFVHEKEKIKGFEHITRSSNKKLPFKCYISGHVFMTTPAHVIENKWCPYPCCAKNALCDDNDCMICFDASFASSSFSLLFSSKNELTPRQIFKCSSLICLFECNNSGHEYYCAISDIGRNNKTKCPYPCCGRKKLCENNDCKMCYEASFASSSFSKWFSNKNKITPRQIFKYSNKNFLFECEKTSHEYYSKPKDIECNMSHGCPFPCCSGQKLCNSDSCTLCYNASFASNEKSNYLDPESGINPRNIYSRSHTKLPFICEQMHKFEASPDKIFSKRWCPCCCIRRNEKECIDIIEKLTGKIFIHCRPDFMEGLEFDGLCPELDMALEYQGEQHYDEDNYFHTHRENSFQRQQERDQRKIELAEKNGIFLIVVPYWITNKEEFITEQYNLWFSSLLPFHEY